jgi:hypothetical protein
MTYQAILSFQGHIGGFAGSFASSLLPALKECHNTVTLYPYRDCQSITQTPMQSGRGVV